MNNNAECANYFKSKKAYHRCMEAFRKKWKTLGKAAGRITLRDTTEEERRAIGGILGKTFHSEDICFDFAKFEQGLQATRFAPVDMKEVLEAYFEEPMDTNQGEKRAKEEQKRNFFHGVRVYFLNNFGSESAAFCWFQEMVSTKKIWISAGGEGI
ncbi:TIGR02679 domain-containing protein [Lachnospiraceae bacterium 45-P1]